MRLRGISATVLATAAVLALSACGGAGGSPSGSSDPTTPAGLSASASKSTSSSLSASEVFRITATITSPEGVATYVESVGMPRPITPSEESTLDAGGCDAWHDFTNPSTQDALVTATLTSGTWPTQNWVVVDAGEWVVFSGDVAPFQAYCATAFANTPGSATGLHVFVGDDPDGAGGWATGTFGFSVVTDESMGAPGPEVPRVTGCLLELGPNAAASSAFVSAWPTNTVQNPDGLSCRFGG